MNNRKSWQDVKELLTFVVPYWAVIILLIAAFKRDTTNLDGFVLCYTIMVASYQEKLMRGIPVIALKIGQWLLILLTLQFLFYKEIRQLIELI